MATLNARGHEVLDQTPVEIPLAKLKRQGPSMFDRMMAQLFALRKEEEEELKDEADLMEELNDFSYEEKNPDLPGSGGYEIDENIPDFVSADMIREEAKKAKEKDEGSSNPDPVES
nr:MAG TPA: hypothetical protein [Microviridae sp.]